jgi:preprotein translocase subunit SecA
MRVMSFLDIFFKKPNKKYLDKIQPLVEKINNLENKFKDFSDKELKDKTKEFKERLKKGETLNDLLPEAFAVVREASKRTLQQRHYDTQLIAGIVLHQGKIAEMKTGEGKTLAATLPLYLNALEGKGCHIVTVNDYLAKRDMVWMGQIYHFLGLTIACLNHEKSYLYKKPENFEKDDQIRDEEGSFNVVDDFLEDCLRKEAYNADIVYGTNNEFGFDYLRNNMITDLSKSIQRDFHYVIIDEIDSILIDEARTPLIISAPDQKSSDWYSEFSRIIPQLKSEKDYEIDEERRTVVLTEEGTNKVEEVLGLKNIYEEKGSRYLHFLEQSLRAQAINPADGKPLFARNRDYVVKKGEVIIIDEFTGRLMPGRRWSNGLHQAIEAKEGVAIQPESVTLASITFQNLFRMYKKLSGMTGTAKSSAEEFDKVYNLGVIMVPTHKPLIRKSLEDKIYKSKKGKLKAVVKEIKKRNEKGQPILVGTRSVEKNEQLSRLLELEGVQHQVLNAKNHEKEGQIIAQAGKLKAVTVATNMAGRGVDIILGGNPQDKEEAKKVKELGGLYVLGTERHESRRIDNQLRGRAGRQGDPGESQFFLSLEDELMRIFGGQRIQMIAEKFDLPEDEPIESGLVSRAIEEAQSRVEGRNFDIRKRVLEYDDVMNKHREVFYKKRKEILQKAEEGKLEDYVFNLMEKNNVSKENYQKKRKEIGEKIDDVEKTVILKIMDMLWINHLESMKYLRESVRLRAYGKQDPLIEYQKEGYKMFQRLLNVIENRIVQALLKVQLRPIKKTPKTYNPSSDKKKVGRNDPCPCGKINPKTGKPMKYKKCCYPKYGR